MQSIPTVAKMLGVRKQSVYRRLDSPELAGHVHETKSGKCLDDAGIEILRVLFPTHADDPQTDADQSKKSPNQSENNPRTSMGTENGLPKDSYIEKLEKEIDFLRSMLTEKDKQLSDLTSAIRMREEQGKAQLVIEASSQVPHVPQEQDIPQQAPKAGFFSRVFRK